MGNSEVGHMIIGSGTIFKQYLVVINEAIDDSSFFDNETLVNTILSAKKSGHKIHLIGFVSMVEFIHT